MTNVFAAKRIVVGITGSIAAFKVAGWVSTLTKEEAQVAVVMTESACKFIAPLTFAALTGEKVYTSMFAEEQSGTAMAHIELAQEASVFLIAPASAHTIARLAHGMADDLLSTAVLATKAPVVVCPAMNTQMYLHKATQENISRLRDLGYLVIDPASGTMACKEKGPGRLVEWDVVHETLLRCFKENDFRGEHVLVTAGPTREHIDPARFISNRSSGKMGYALAEAASRRGAKVTLVSGPTSLACPYGVDRIDVQTAEEMYQVMMREFPNCTILIKAAAVSDFRPAQVYAEKVKKENADGSIKLTANPDILYEIGRLRREAHQVVVGFAAESCNLHEEGKRKLRKKNLDLIAVNDISLDTTGFEVDTNRILLIDAQESKQLPFGTKSETADMILNHIVNRFRCNTPYC
ncbi:MAG: bifunctional phosphopantothenoylcysteine decarboxylase/phosphopantothenate--cysteine ligase CoaBC [Desulfopila sp.]|jgi:phosphopantothenoylcysteine decarboxylase/phosphopantothenate--cysteine ligase|nr:bifunctional phosphopantothenoylcysteine decarboxylase/phosphopantothenate--cysteine ligase CoaBC [Desulfopila sp.]